MQHGVKATGWPFQGGGGRVLPCINHTGMCHPKGWHILVWNRAGFGELGGTPHQEFPGVHPHPLTIFPNLCLWQCSLFSNFGGIDHEKNFSGRACLQTTPPPLLGQGMEDLAIPTLKSCENIGPPPSSNIGPKEKISFLIWRTLMLRYYP